MKLIVIFFSVVIFVLLLKFDVKLINDNDIFSLKFYILLFGVIKILVFSKKIKPNISLVNLISKIDFKKSKEFKKFKIISQKIKYKVKRFRLKLEIGTKNIVNTVFLNTLISSNISILLGSISNRIEDKNLSYSVIPDFTLKRKLNVDVDCIFRFSFVNIIYIVFLTWFRLK